MRNLTRNSKDVKTIKNLLLSFVLLAIAIFCVCLINKDNSKLLKKTAGLNIKGEDEDISTYTLPENLPQNGTMKDDYGIVNSVTLTGMLDRKWTMGCR